VKPSVRASVEKLEAPKDVAPKSRIAEKAREKTKSALARENFLVKPIPTSKEGWQQPFHSPVVELKQRQTQTHQILEGRTGLTSNSEEGGAWQPTDSR